jgi:hypothetical protein
MLCTPHIEKDFTAGNFVRDAGGLIPLSPYKGLIFSPVVILAALGIFRTTSRQVSPAPRRFGSASQTMVIGDVAATAHLCLRRSSHDDAAKRLSLTPLPQLSSIKSN